MKLPYIEAGEIVTTHGVRGEVKVLSWLDSPEMLCEFDRCRISGREYVMDSVRVQKTCNLVKLRGVDTMEDAQKLRGKTMELYREDISDELIFACRAGGRGGLRRRCVHRQDQRGAGLPRQQRLRRAGGTGVPDPRGEGIHSFHRSGEETRCR